MIQIDLKKRTLELIHEKTGGVHGSVASVGKELFPESKHKQHGGNRLHNALSRPKHKWTDLSRAIKFLGGGDIYMDSEGAYWECRFPLTPITPEHLGKITRETAMKNSPIIADTGEAVFSGFDRNTAGSKLSAALGRPRHRWNECSRVLAHFKIGLVLKGLGEQLYFYTPPDFSGHRTVIKTLPLNK